jgi:sulfur carrier protein ThiS
MQKASLFAFKDGMSRNFMYIFLEGKRITIRGTAVGDVLASVGINPETVLVSRDNEILLETDKLHNGDKLELVRVISGG